MEKKRIYSLDLLKFIVSIIIIFYHLQQETRLGISTINLVSGKIYTWYIVELFFIISGFISMSNFSSDEKIKSTLERKFLFYFKHKFIRIYPIAVLSIIFTIFCGFLYRLYFGNWWNNIVPGLWRVFKVIFLVNGGFLNLDIVYGSFTWYLSVLLLCYFFEYFIIYLCKRLSLKIEYLFIFMIVSGITGYCYGLNLPLLSYYTCRGYSSFFIGCMIYKIYNNQNIEKRKLIVFSIIGLSICIITGIINFDLFYDDETCQWGIFTVVLNPSILIIFLELNRWFKSSKWKILGNISFEMYLFHMPFIILYLIVCNFFHKVCIPEMLQIIIFIVFTIIISFVIFNLIEKPVTKKLSNQFELNQSLQKE